MSDQPGNNVAYENNRHANLVSVAHHSGVVIYFSSAFVTLVGFFSTGAFTVGLTILSTDFGRKIIAANSHWWIAAYFLSFGFSMLLDLLAVIMLINYSFRSMNDHRNAIHKNLDFAETRDRTGGGYGMAIAAFAAAALMFIGGLVAVLITYNALSIS